MFPLFKRGAQKIRPVLRGGGRKKFRTHDFPFCMGGWGASQVLPLQKWGVGGESVSHGEVGGGGGGCRRFEV